MMLAQGGGAWRARACWRGESHASCVPDSSDDGRGVFRLVELVEGLLWSAFEAKEIDRR